MKSFPFSQCIIISYMYISFCLNKQCGDLLVWRKNELSVFSFQGLIFGSGHFTV